MKPSVEERIIQRLGEFAEALESRKPIKDEFNCRRIVLKLRPKPYSPEMVKDTRAKLGASQAVFALYLGVSPKTVQAWEQGDHPPNKMACRFMDQIQRNIDLHRDCLREMVVEK